MNIVFRNPNPERLNPATRPPGEYRVRAAIAQLTEGTLRAGAASGRAGSVIANLNDGLWTLADGSGRTYSDVIIS